MPKHCSPWCYTDIIANDDNDDDDDVEEALAREERYIALYQAELERLSKKNTGNSPKDEASKDHASSLSLTRVEDFLAQLLKDTTYRSVGPDHRLWMPPTEATNETTSQRLQIAIRPFCFTSVEMGPASSSSSVSLDAASPEYDYVLHGYFVVAPEVPVRIRLRLATGPKGDDGLHIVHVECRLEAHWEAVDAVHRHVDAVVRELLQGSAGTSASHDLYLPLWITCMNEYLEFDGSRRSLPALRTTCACPPPPCTVRHCGPRSYFDLPIFPLRRPGSMASSSLRPTPLEGKDNGNDEGMDVRNEAASVSLHTKPSHILSLVCSWRWNDRKASLRLSQDHSWPKKTSSSSILRQSDLDQLVVACNNDCWQALSLLRTHCSGCTCWKNDLDPSWLSSSPSTRQRSVPDLPSTYLQDPVDDADDEGDDEEEDDEDGPDYVDLERKNRRKRRPPFWNDRDDLYSVVVDEEPLNIADTEPTSPHRLSPSGRRRSDYEVQRLVRIERNESKLSQLGLLRTTSHAAAGDSFPKRRTKRRRLLLPMLSGSKRMYPPTTVPPRSKGTHRPPIARPKHRPSPNSTTTEPGMETSGIPSGFVETEDGFLLPKIPPSRTEDGFSFKRPRGAAPAGYHWDSWVGLWVPLPGHHPKLDRSEMASKSTLPPTFKGFVVTEDNCLLPKKELEKDADGISFKRPRGAPPLGFDWNPFRGVWEPIDTVGQSPLQDAAPRAVSVPLEIDDESDHGLSDPLPMDEESDHGATSAGKVPFVTDTSDSVLEQQTWNGYFVTSGGCLFPKTNVERDIADGVFKRPLDTAPPGYHWDPMRGLWEPTRTSDPAERSRASTEKQSETRVALANHIELDFDPTFRTENANKTTNVSPDDHGASDLAMWKDFKVTDEGFLLPKQDPKRDKDGSSFKRPTGAAPLGFCWDPLRGLWQPTEALTESRTERDVAEPTENASETSVLQSFGLEPDRDQTTRMENSTEATYVSADVQGKSDRIVWKDFKISDEGCLFPKQVPKRDKDGTSFKRPKGAAPLGFCWDPLRGLWQPTEPMTENTSEPALTPTEYIAETPILHSNDAEPDPDQTENAIETTGVSADVQATNDLVIWKGFKVTDEGCLFPKQEPKRDNDGSSFKRPKGAAPLGYCWDPLRGLWQPAEPVTENTTEFALAPAENDTETPTLQSNNTEPDPDQTSTTGVSADVQPTSDFVIWKGFKVTDEGCLFPKQEPKRDNDGTSFKRPKGAAPWGFCWDPLRGLWQPTEMRTENRKVLDVAPILQSPMMDANEMTYLSSDVQDTRNLLVWKGFKVTDEGCLFPKQALQRDKDGSSFKRPKGAAPLGYCWDPLRGLWQRTEVLAENRTELAVASTETNTETQSMQSPSTMYATGTTIVSADVQDTSDLVIWKGFKVTDDGCLFPKQALLRDKDGSSFRRPKGAAPLGYRWDPLRGLWQPTEAVAESQRQLAVAPTETNTETQSLQCPSTMYANETTHVSADVQDTSDLVIWKGFKITDEGCLFPKQAPQRDKDGASFKRPKGAAPLGYRWDPLRGLWNPTEAAVKIPTELVVASTEKDPVLQSLNVEPDPDPTRRAENAKETTHVSVDFPSTSDLAIWKGFKVTDEGCLLPKRAPKRDKDGASFKRPKGVAPAGFRWDPRRGLWMPGMDLEHPLPRDPSDRTLRERVMDDLMGGDTWRGYDVTADGCLRPRTEPKRLQNASSGFKRPLGAAPRGFRWNPVRGVWDGDVPADRAPILKATIDPPDHRPLPEEPPPAPSSGDAGKDRSVLFVPLAEASTRPQRSQKARSLQRYSPPLRK